MTDNLIVFWARFTTRIILLIQNVLRFNFKAFQFNYRSFLCFEKLCRVGWSQIQFKVEMIFKLDLSCEPRSGNFKLHTKALRYFSPKLESPSMTDSPLEAKANGPKIRSDLFSDGRRRMWTLPSKTDDLLEGISQKFMAQQTRWNENKSLGAVAVLFSQTTCDISVHFNIFPNHISICEFGSALKLCRL